MKLILNILFFISLLLLPPLSVRASKSYDTPESMSTRPRNPHVLRDEGVIFRRAPWVLTIPPNTFSYDVYFEHGCRKKTFPMRLGRYWQVSDICEFHPRSHFNRAAAEINRAWMIGFEYTQKDLGLIGGLGFPAESLKIVFSDDNGKSWTMLKSSIVDEEGQTVAAITDKPGGYMVMAGFVNPNTYYSYSDIESVKGVSTSHSGPVNLSNPLSLLMSLFESLLHLTSGVREEVRKL